MLAKLTEVFRDAAGEDVAVEIRWLSSKVPVIVHPDAEAYECDVEPYAFDTLYDRIQSFTNQTPKPHVFKQYWHAGMSYECEAGRQQERVQVASFRGCARVAPHWLALLSDEVRLPAERFPSTRDLNDVREVERRSFRLTPQLALVFETHAWERDAERARYLYFACAPKTLTDAEGAARLVDKYAALLT